mmetsp:Transcript_24438/g.55092  ORF Transcript_24438/g.55092 Transcript_24438/m.55092 type:complete len:241 (+) Transcript_24438:635-1357(+)
MPLSVNQRVLHCIYYTAAAKVHWERILRDVIAPLNAFDRIYISTTNSSCPEADDSLIGMMRPRALKVSRARSSIAASYVEVLEMIVGDTSELDAFVLVRFDVLYSHPITDLGIVWTAFNYLWRDNKKGWDDCHMTSDIFFAAPVGHAPVLYDAAQWASGQHKRIRDPRSGAICSVSGGMHFTYDKITGSKTRRGQEIQINFIDQTFHSSRPEEDPNHRARIAYIDRSCGKWIKSCTKTGP